MSFINLLDSFLTLLLYMLQSLPCISVAVLSLTNNQFLKTLFMATFACCSWYGWMKQNSYGFKESRGRNHKWVELKIQVTVVVCSFICRDWHITWNVYMSLAGVKVVVVAMMVWSVFFIKFEYEDCLKWKHWQKRTWMWLSEVLIVV